VDRLLAAGYARVTVLDLSGTALKAVGDRLPPELRSRVKLIEADVLKTELPPHSVDVWHDRAVFHFLIERADRCAYVAQVQRALRPGGHVIVSTFAEDGPTTCSGLPVARYDSAGLHAIFGARFELLDSVREQHITPSGGRQAFQYCVCRMRAASSQAA
jgi:ubiquinone/menaquinone biosynthesis C-methylase UbiE